MTARASKPSKEAKAPREPRVSVAPFVIQIDTREQPHTAYEFGLFRDPRGGLMEVRSVRQKLDTGDYSIVGHDLPTPGGGFCLERKELNDLVNTICGDRERFIRELERMQHFAFKAILIEATFADVLAYTSPNARGLSDAQRAARPLSVINSLNTWFVEYGVAPLFVSRDRSLCRAVVVRLAERFHRKMAERRGAGGGEAGADMGAGLNPSH